MVVGAKVVGGMEGALVEAMVVGAMVVGAKAAMDQHGQPFGQGARDDP